MIGYVRHLVEDHIDPQAQADGLEFVRMNLYSNDDPQSLIYMDINHVRNTWRQPTVRQPYSHQTRQNPQFGLINWFHWLIRQALRILI